MLSGVTFLVVKDVLDLWYCGYFLFLAAAKLWNQQEDEASRQRRNKKKLLESITTNNAVEIDEIDERADKVEKPEDAADIIKQYEEILRAKRKGIIVVAFYQGKIFKHSKEKEKFQQMVGKLKIHKNTIVFKINVFKLIEKYPKLMKSSVTLTFLKNYFKDIKQTCKENSREFE